MLHERPARTFVKTFNYHFPEIASRMNKEENDDSISEVISLLNDQFAAAILAEASTEAMSANELADRCNTTASTVYKRIRKLRKYDLLCEEQVMDPGGHHYKRYKTILDQITIGINDGEYIVEVTVTEEEGDAVDRLSRMYEGLR